MANSEVLYVKGMNMSESDIDDDGVENIWDDTKLNDAYDKALRIANAEVAKRLAMSTNSKTGKNETAAPKPKKEKQKSTKNKKPAEWKAGMACRAVYDGDGLEYEAFVLRIINDKECVVRFLGYNNSEIVAITTLKQSLGKEEQSRQIEEAFVERADDEYSNESNADRMEFVNERTLSPASTDKSYQKSKKSSKKKKQHIRSDSFDLPEMPFPMPNLATMRNLGCSELPMPPVPPASLPALAPESEDQAVSSMLLSWYMSGYYTGLYHGMRRSRGRRNH